MRTHDYNVTVPNFTETQDNNFLFLFLNFDTVLQNSTPKNLLLLNKQGSTVSLQFEVFSFHIVSKRLKLKAHSTSLFIE